MNKLKFCIMSFAVIATISFVAFSVQASDLREQEAIDNFYLERDGRPLWVKGKRLSKGGKKLYSTIQKSWENGLNPDRYFISDIDRIMEEGRYLNKDRALQVELLLTSGYIRYVQDLSGMRVNASSLGLRENDWLQRISISEAISLLPDDLKNIDAFLHSREPQSSTYQRLKVEMKRLVDSNSGNNERLNVPVVFSRVLYPGRGDKNIPALRARLGVYEENLNDLYTYDTALVNAVKEFQASKGLKEDGIIGKQTLFALNHGKSDKIRQIIVNMERLRWIPDEKPERFIVVNIPSARLWAIDNGSVEFTMPVVVGRKKRATPPFISKIHGVRFNPTWTVPPTIKKEDILPSLQENPSYLADKGMELFDGYGRDATTLDPSSIDWNTISENELNNLNMVQIPGEHNPLGRIRVLMPNEYDIYLHDTNNKSLFSRSDRTKSSGCIRMRDPDKVATFALKNRNGWSNDKMKDVLKTGKIKDVYTSDKVSVYILYYTVWLDENGNVMYGQDIYGRDDDLFAMLKKLDAIPIIVDNDNIVSAAAD